MGLIGGTETADHRRDSVLFFIGPQHLTVGADHGPYQRTPIQTTTRWVGGVWASLGDWEEVVGAPLRPRRPEREQAPAPGRRGCLVGDGG